MGFFVYNYEVKKWRSDALFISALSLLVFIFFARLFFPSPLKIFVTPDFGTSDLLHFYYPIKNLLSQSLKNFELPLWSPNVGGGFPMHAEGQTGTFNIVNLILFRFLPTPTAFNLVYIISFLTISISTYFWAQLLKLPKSVSFFVAAVFPFSGFYIAHISHTSLVQTASFLPLELLFIELFIQKKKLAFLILFSLAVSQQIFTGLAQITLFSLIFLIPYVIFRLHTQKKTAGVKQVLIQAALIFGATILSLVLSAAQILPSWELTNLSVRQGGLSFYEIFALPFTLRDILTFLSPTIFGSPQDGTYFARETSGGIFWENTGYVGILTLILAVIGTVWLFKKNKVVFFFASAFIISLLLVLGKDSPTYILFASWPFNLFRVPSRFLLISDLALVTLAGFGILVLLNLKFIKKFKYKNFIPVALTLVAILDIFFYFYSYHPVGEAEKWTQKPKTAAFVENNKNLYRIYTVGSYIPWNEVFLKKGWQDSNKYLSFLSDLNADYNLLSDTASLNIHVTIPTRRLSLFRSIVEKGITVNQETRTVFIDKKSRELLSLSNVKYLVTPFPLGNTAGFKLVYTENSKDSYPYQIYENLKVLDRAFFATNATIVKSIPELSQRVLSEEFNPVTTVILEKEIGSQNRQLPGNIVKVQEYTNNKVVVDTSTASSGFLVLSDSYYPGWKVYVDGQERELLAANINQRAVYLEKGENIIVFSYEPQSVKVGVGISLVFHTLIGIILLYLFLKTFLNRKKVP